MGLFRNRNRPRTALDIRVGSSHVVEVLLHLRRADWTWYRANEKEIEDELMILLESCILSRMFGDEVEAYHRRMNPHLFADESQIGSKNVKNRPKKSVASKKKGRKAKAAAPQVVQETATELKKQEKEVYFAFGDTLQLAYRKEELPQNDRSLGGRTLFCPPDDENTTIITDCVSDANHHAEYQYLPKLSHRLLIWCSKNDPNNPTNQDAENVGFLRQDMIPIVSLFREPKETMDTDTR